MENNKCPHCGGLVTREIPYGERRYKNIGTVRVAPDKHDVFWECESCGYIWGNYMGLEHLDEAGREILIRRLKVMFALCEHPSKEWASAMETAIILGVGPSALMKGKVENSDSIYRVSIGGDTYFNRKSIELYKERGDGFFPIHCLYKQIADVYDGEPEQAKEDENVNKADA